MCRSSGKKKKNITRKSISLTKDSLRGWRRWMNFKRTTNNSMGEETGPHVAEDFSEVQR